MKTMLHPFCQYRFVSCCQIAYNRHLGSCYLEVRRTYFRRFCCTLHQDKCVAPVYPSFIWTLLG